MYYIMRVSGSVRYDETESHSVVPVISSTKKKYITKAWEDYKDIDIREDEGCGCCFSYEYYCLKEGK